MPAPVPPPPERPVLQFSRAETPPLNEEQSPASRSFSGVELIVRGLHHTHPPSAANHLRGILQNLRKAHPEKSAYITSVIVTQADTTRPINYAFISVNPALAAEPRPDILAELLPLLNAVPEIKGAGWRCCKNADRTLRVTFTMEKDDDLVAKRELVNKALNDRNIPWQGSYPSEFNGTKRLTYDLLDVDDVEKLLEKPPVINHVTLTPVRTRLVQPIYGLEVGILGGRDWQNMRASMDAYLREAYGRDAIAASRTELGGDLYTVVLKNWDITTKFLSDTEKLKGFFAKDPVTNSLRLTVPMFLFLMNSEGLSNRNNANILVSPQSRSNQDAQIQLLRKQGEETVQAFRTVIRQQQLVINTIQTQFRELVTSNIALHGAFELSNQVNRLDRRLQAERSELTACRMMKLATRDPAEVVAIEADIQKHTLAVDDLVAKVNEAESRYDAISTNLAHSLAALQAAGLSTESEDAIPSVPLVPDHIYLTQGDAAVALIADDAREVEQLVDRDDDMDGGGDEQGSNAKVTSESDAKDDTRMGDDLD
ncbi:hypothetical protein PsYK624_162550 [Phanerochaete sordida]|uniref:Uncharacterized protein n=1 Tax=Phanerochaete sordida TaxID=48140 RepID=A0A9P3GQH2_9APHY|nr:hypothetical protein PsYK624_162550 [Phanerochaete sordida]